MNADVLFNIAAFADMDSRRSMGFQPRKLQRNAELDAKLKTLHAMFKIKYHGWLSMYKIHLNDRMYMTVDVIRRAPGGHFIEYHYKKSSNPFASPYGSSKCQFHVIGQIFLVKSSMFLDTPLHDGSLSVDAYFKNGKWVVEQGESGAGRYPTLPDYPVLERFGYVIQ
jgi:hypothetical protein